MNDINKLLTKLAEKLEEDGAKEEAEEVKELIKPEDKKVDSLADKHIKVEVSSMDGKNVEAVETSGVESGKAFEFIFHNLTDMADKLDASGATKEADAIDEMLKKFAADVKWEKEDTSTLQSKRYDSKHNNEQTFKPNKPVKEKETKHHNPSSQETGDKMLSSRYCPDHQGVMLHRVGEGIYMCSLDGKTYNWYAGWIGADGKKHPGGSISGQTESATNVPIPSRVFDPREDVLNRIN